MPTARELLEQAEALMRRDRAAPPVEPGALMHDDASIAHGRGGSKEVEARSSGVPADDIPTLTDVVDAFDDSASPAAGPPDDDEPSILDTDAIDDEAIEALEPDVHQEANDEEPRKHSVEEHTGTAAAVANDESAVTDSIVDSDLVAALESPPWPVPALDPAALAAHDPPAEPSFGLPARILDDIPASGLEPIAAPLPAARPAPTRSEDAGAQPASDEERWNALAEEIRMQVLQRIDIFTDTGLKEQLNVRLQPIVDRASADLVAAINQHVGQLLREYVAEAIEREIQKWREEKDAA